MKNQPAMQGSASVLIILVMLSLSAFGVLSLMSAYSDLKLARKHADFVQEYYRLDDQGVSAFAQAKAAVQDGGTPADLGWDFDADTGLYTVVLGHNDLNLTVQARLTSEGLEIARWQEWQEEFEYDMSIPEIWSGEVEP